MGVSCEGLRCAVEWPTGAQLRVLYKGFGEFWRLEVGLSTHSLAALHGVAVVSLATVRSNNSEEGPIATEPLAVQWGTTLWKHSPSKQNLAVRQTEKKE